MASPISIKLCEPCKEERKETKACALCYECHELLCKECSKWHLKFKDHKNHSLIALVSFFTNSISDQNLSKSKSTSDQNSTSDQIPSESKSTSNQNSTANQNPSEFQSTSDQNLTFDQNPSEPELTSTQNSTAHQNPSQFKSTSEQNLPSYQSPSTSEEISTSSEDDELASHSIEHPTLTENTVPYQGAQVAVKSTTSKTKKRTTSRQTDPRLLKATQRLQYSVKRPEDKKTVWVWGVLCVSRNMVVVDHNNKALKLFDQSGTYLSSTALKDYTYGITCVGDSTFATCGLSNTVYLWSVRVQSIFSWRRQTIVSEDVYHVEHVAYGIHYNGTYYCVLHRDNNTITVLDRQGGLVRKIKMVEACGKKFVFRWDIHMDNDTHNIYVPCWDEDGVLCMTLEGGALWFTPLSRPWGITEIQGTLCVADYSNACLHMITKEGKYVRKLLDRKDLAGKPEYVCYGQDGKLYVSYDSSYDGRDVISLYTVK